MPVQEKVSAIEFTQDTGLSAEEIRTAGRHAAEGARTFMKSTVSEAASTGSSITYHAKGPGGFVKQMTMQVSWEELGEGRRRVRFSIGDYLTQQSKVAFIPVGPKQVIALSSATRFAEALRAELAAA